MFRRITLALVVVGGLAFLTAPAACADFPSPANSTSPVFIRVVGLNAGVADTVAGKFSVTLRYITNDPMPGAHVLVDLSGCPDIHLAGNQLNPNYEVSCASRTVGAYTNADGVVAFTLVGSSWAAGVHSGLSCARIYANGLLLSSPTVAAFDLDGASGVSISDLSAWLGDLGSGVYAGRSDYDGSGSLSVADLSVWMRTLGSNRSTVSGTACP